MRIDGEGHWDARNGRHSGEGFRSLNSREHLRRVHATGEEDARGPAGVACMAYDGKKNLQNLRNSHKDLWPNHLSIADSLNYRLADCCRGRGRRSCPPTAYSPEYVCGQSGHLSALTVRVPLSRGEVVGTPVHGECYRGVSAVGGPCRASAPLIRAFSRTAVGDSVAAFLRPVAGPHPPIHSA